MCRLRCLAFNLHALIRTNSARSSGKFLRTLDILKASSFCTFPCIYISFYISGCAWKSAGWTTFREFSQSLTSIWPSCCGMVTDLSAELRGPTFELLAVCIGCTQAATGRQYSWVCLRRMAFLLWRTRFSARSDQRAGVSSGTRTVFFVNTLQIKWKCKVQVQTSSSLYRFSHFERAFPRLVTRNIR